MKVHEHTSYLIRCFFPIEFLGLSPSEDLTESFDAYRMLLSQQTEREKR